MLSLQARSRALEVFAACFDGDVPPPPCNASGAADWYARAVESVAAFKSCGRLREYAQVVASAIEVAESVDSLPNDVLVLFDEVPAHGDDEVHEVVHGGGGDEVHDDDDAMIRCKKCGGRAEWTQRQTRSADEAMTVFATCTKCRRTWRF